ncbi:MAG: primosomal protein N' [Rhodospirillales bacterium]|nr:primosomal protein N' [Rhodospirillales bacterium]
MPSARARSRHGAGGRVSVMLPLPLAGAYDYRVPAGLDLADGDFVRVPLAARQVAGVVWGAATGAVAPEKLKQVSARLPVPPLDPVARRFVEWVAAYTCSPPGAVLKMVMSVPAALEPPAPIMAYARGAAEVRMTKARRRVFDVLAEGPPLPAPDLARQAAVGPSVVRGLAVAGALVAVPMAAASPGATPSASAWRLEAPALSAGQAAAAEELAARVEGGGFAVTVLDGVPGAGKTEVYFHALAGALRGGHQALVLLPEIALGAQWLSRFRERFGVEPAVWHSDLGARRRRLTWRAVAEGAARVVVGARSALFLPYPDLGLIVVDEEHDGAYKQEEGVVYGARDMAVARAHLGDVPAVLVSATPSLETVVNVRRGRYAVLHLPDRHAGATLPQVRLVDMRAEPPARSAWLSPPLLADLREALDGGEQAMLFLNRRGYAPLTLCRACGHRLQCPQCTAWLVEHRRAGRLLCHHCGHSVALPGSCPACEAPDSLAACGPGVERLAEEVVEAFPGIRHAIAASDTVGGPRAAEDLVRRIEDHDVDLIIGTQILAKGYHFPMLTLVGVVDADLGLAGGDLRAAERTFQLLYQVAGRAGRAERPGRVLVQTYMPEHPVMRALASGRRDRFVEVEAKARQEAGMPPFGRLVALIVSGRDEVAVDAAARLLGQTAPRGPGVVTLGPAPAPLGILRGMHRRRLLLKAEINIGVQAIVRRWLARAPVPRRVRVRVDVDPNSFL